MIIFPCSASSELTGHIWGRPPRLSDVNISARALINATSGQGEVFFFLAFILYIYLFLRSEQNSLAVSYKEEMRKQEVRCVTEDYCPANSANVLIFRRREA